MPSSPRRCGRNKTVGGVNWIDDKSVQFSVVNNLFIYVTNAVQYTHTKYNDRKES